MHLLIPRIYNGIQRRRRQLLSSMIFSSAETKSAFVCVAPVDVCVIIQQRPSWKLRTIQLFQIDLNTKSLQQERGYLAIKMIEWRRQARDLLRAWWKLYWERRRLQARILYLFIMRRTYNTQMVLQHAVSRHQYERNQSILDLAYILKYIFPWS